MSLYVLPVILFLVHSVTSVDLYRSHRVPRQLITVESSYNFNHPPIIERRIPVTVLYDYNNEEDIEVIGKSIKEVKSSSEDEELNHQISGDEGESNATPKFLRPEVLYGNHPPIVEDYNAVAVAVESDNNEESALKSISENNDNVNKEEILTTSLDETNDVKNSNVTENIIKPKGRSLNIEANDSKNDKLSASTTSTASGNSQRGRLRRVNKVKVNKNQATDGKTENTQNKVVQKEIVASAVAETNHNNNDKINKNPTFQKRTREKDPVVPIIDSESYLYAFGGDYHYSYQGGDGTKAFAKGELKTDEHGSSGADVVGGFSYKDKDGNDYSLSYTADENGYRPVGAHLPTPPPIPIAIQRALAFLATKTTPEPITERINKSS